MLRGLLLFFLVALALLLAACEGAVDEAASGTVVGRIEEGSLGPGKSAKATLDLSRGSYVLICNVPGHYKDGMYSSFQVADPGVTAASSVDIELGEWFVKPGVTSVGAGAITLQVTNKGSSGHNLVVIQTGLAPGALVVK